MTIVCCCSLTIKVRLDKNSLSCNTLITYPVVGDVAKLDLLYMDCHDIMA